MEETIEGMRRAERRLRKVKLNSDGGLTIEWHDVMVNDKTNQTFKADDSKTSDAVAHSDFHEAFNRLREHLMFACEWVKPPKNNVRPLFDGTTAGADKFRVGSVTLSGGEEVTKEKKGVESKVKKPVAVHIYGRRKLSSGHVVNFGTYGIKLDHAQEPYLYAAELHDHIEQVEEEAWEYLAGKVQPPVQTSLQLNSSEQTDLAEQAKELEDAEQG